jgi:hypothetical protein
MRFETYDHNAEDDITRLLVGRKVTKVDHETLSLDDGTILKVLPNDGCGGCTNGYYELEALNEVENAIMSVEFTESQNLDMLSIFVYCEGVETRQQLLEVSGDDGNGYYGYGYRIRVIRPEDWR